MHRLKFPRKLRLTAVIFAILCCGAVIAFAANSALKPSVESEVPGTWTADHGNSNFRYLWFSYLDPGTGDKVQDALNYYSPEVRKHFPDPDMSEFGDHPDFVNGMNDNYDDPTGIVKFLTNAQMNDYLESLPKTNMTIRYMGDYPKGIRMPVLIFSEPKLDDPSGENLRALGKPIYYLRAQVHGNESATSSGAILLAQRLARGHADFAGILDKVSIVILPRMNSDGTKIHQRGTSLVSGDTWATGAPDYHVSQGEGGGVSEYGGGIMAGLDQNRDNLWLGTPASRANARILAEFKPEVVLDAHEYGSSGYFGLPSKDINPIDGTFKYVTSGDRLVLRNPYPGTLSYYKETMTTQWGNNLLIPERIREINEQVQQLVIAGLADPGNPSGTFYWAPYVEGKYGLNMSAADPSLSASTDGLISLDQLPTQAERDHMAVWQDADGNVPHYNNYNVSTEGGFDPGTARNMMGLTPAISMLTESRSAGGRWEFPRRVMGQYLTSRYLIQALADNAEMIMREVSTARQDVINDAGSSKLIAVRQGYAAMDYTNIVSYGIYNADGSSEDIPGSRRNSRFGTEPTVEVTRPYAYIMDGSYSMADTIAFRMSHLGIAFERLSEPTTLEVTAYVVTQTGTVGPSFGGSSRVNGASASTVTRTFPAGSYVFPMDQQMANFMIALFEPTSMRSWIGKDVADFNAILHKETPFYRYELAAEIPNAQEVQLPILDFTDVFLFNSLACSMAEMEEASAEVGETVYGQTAVIYGTPDPASNLRAYLPSDGNRRGWYVYNNNDETYECKTVDKDEAMNRYYIEIAPAEIASYTPTILTTYADGYYAIKLLATPAADEPRVPAPAPVWSGGSSSCNAGMNANALLLLVSVGIFTLRRRGGD